MDLGISPAHTADKLDSVIGLATIVRGLTNNTDRLASRHDIAKVTSDVVSAAKAYSDYIKHYEYEIIKVFEFENVSGTQLNQMTRPDQDISLINPESRINHESRINPDNRINSQIQINSPIRPTFNIQLTRPKKYSTDTTNRF